MEDIAQAALDRLKAAWKPAQVHAPGDVPDKAVTPYAVPYLDGGRDSTMLLDGTAGTDAYRLMPMAVGKTDAEVNRAADGIQAAYRGHRLVIPGYATTPCVKESSGGIVRDPDGGGLLSKTFFFTFTVTPQE